MVDEAIEKLRKIKGKAIDINLLQTNVILLFSSLTT